MPSRQHNNRLEYSRRINTLGIIVIPCERYARLQKECYLMVGSKKCGNCTQRGCSYNTIDDSLVQFAKIDKERERLEGRLHKAMEEEEMRIAEASTARARWKRIKIQLQALQEREKKLVVRGANTLAEMDEIADKERRLCGEVEAVSPGPFDIKEFNRFAEEIDWGDVPNFLSAAAVGTSEAGPSS